MKGDNKKQQYRVNEQIQAAIEAENIKNGKKPKKVKKEEKEEKYKKNEIVTDNDNENDEEMEIHRTVIPEQIKSLIVLKGHPKHVTSLCSLRDGSLASGGRDKMIFIWNVKEKSIIHYLEGHLGYVSALYQLNEGNLVSGDEFCNIIVWSKNFKYKVASVYQDGTITKFYQLINGDLFSISSKNLMKIWTFNRSKGKEKEINEEEERQKKLKEKKKKKKKKKRQKTKEEIKMEENYNLKDEDFNDIYKFIENAKKDLENSEEEDDENKKMDMNMDDEDD